MKTGPAEIHIWTGSFQSNTETSARMTSLLSPAEIKRAQAFRFPGDRIRYIQAHTLLRRILSEYSGIDPGDIELESGPHGKPHFKGAHQIHFNLSHTKEMMVAAVSSQGEVGIDIEKRDDMNDMEDVGRQFMSDDEFRLMSGLPENLRKNYFYSCWVRKEALLKAAGIGLGDHLRLVSVMKGPGHEDAKLVSASFERKGSLWWLETFAMPSDHVGAVCIEAASTNTDYSISFRTINWSDPFE